MAKNIFEKKKRVARVKSLHDEDYADMLPAEIDYVSDIIKNMDSNFDFGKINSTKLNQNKTKVTSKTELNKFVKDPEVPSASKNCTQFFKSKTFRTNKKFPLMEKSQKVLKQLKHNQSTPKQRAHLSNIPVSPATNNCFKSKFPKKIKNLDSMTNVKNKIHNKGPENVKVSCVKKPKSLEGTEKSTSKNTKDSHNMILRPSHINSKNIVPKSTKKTKASSKNINETPNILNGNNKNSIATKKSKDLDKVDSIHSFRKNNLGMTHDNNSKSSESHRNESTVNNRSGYIGSDTDDTTDSEFEKFIERNKKSSGINSKTIVKKGKTVKKSSKKTVRKLSDSESSSDEDPPIKCKKKKLKVSYKRDKPKSDVFLADESLTDQMDVDIPIRESSCESDTAPVITTCCSLNKPKPNVFLADESLTDQMDVDMPIGKSSCENDTAPVITTCCSLNTQLWDNTNTVSLTEPCVDEDHKICTYSLNNDETLAANSQKANQNKIVSINNSLDSNNCVNSSLFFSESSRNIDENKIIGKMEIEIPECIELSSSEEEDDSVQPYLNKDLATEVSKKYLKNILENSERNTLHATAANLEKSYLEKTTEDIFNPITKDSEYIFKTEETINNNISKDFEHNLKTEETINNNFSKSSDRNLKMEETNDISEDSDLEIIDVVIAESKEIGSSIAANSSSSKLYRVESSVNESVPRVKCEPSIGQITNIKVENENPKFNVNVNNSIHGAVYTTDICKINDSKDALKYPQHLSYITVAEKIKAFEDGSRDQLIGNRMKEEKNDDDDITIIDFAEPNVKLRNNKMSCEDTNISHEKVRMKIKRELPDILVNHKNSLIEQNAIMEKTNLESYLANEENFKKECLKKEDTKLAEEAYNRLSTKSLALGNLIPLLQLKEWNISEKNVNISRLIELFKQEFHAYQELLDIEKSLETRLKNFETKQTEKLMLIKSVIEHFVSEEGNNSLKANEAFNKMCNLKEFKNLLDEEHAVNSVFNCQPEIKTEKEENLSKKSSPLLLPASIVEKKTDFSSFPSHCLDLIKPKVQPVSVESSNKYGIVAKKLLGVKCIACHKNAVAACQRCAKVFFCSNECGEKSWIDGHKDECIKQ